jgi:hypothetical protein
MLTVGILIGVGVGFLFGALCAVGYLAWTGTDIKWEKE